MDQEAPPLIVWLYTAIILLAVGIGVVAMWAAGIDVWSLLV